MLGNARDEQHRPVTVDGDVVHLGVPEVFVVAGAQDSGLEESTVQQRNRYGGVAAHPGHRGGAGVVAGSEIVPGHIDRFVRTHHLTWVSCYLDDSQPRALQIPST